MRVVNTLSMALGLLLSANPLFAAGKTVRSADFCVKAWFPGSPAEVDDDRVATDQKIPLRARNFWFVDDRGAFILTAIKFDRRYLTERDVPAYFESAIRSHVRKLRGKVANVAPAEFQGMPARTFEVRWSQGGAEWQSHNFMCYQDGHAYSFGVSHPVDVGLTSDGKAFLDRVRIDRGCVASRQ